MGGSVVSDATHRRPCRGKQECSDVSGAPSISTLPKSMRCPIARVRLSHVCMYVVVYLFANENTALQRVPRRKQEELPSSFFLRADDSCQTQLPCAAENIAE